MTGPFETEAEVLALPEVRAIYDAMHASTRRGVGDERCHRLLCDALDQAGVKLGVYDHRIALWLAGWEPQTGAVIAAWVGRAHRAGVAEGSLTADESRIVLAALADASEGIRERAAVCPACRAHPAALCEECAGRLDKASEYEILARHLGNAPDDGQGLNATAKATLAEHGITADAWARAHFADGRWHGDTCGCPDDRCIGYHHDGPDDCGCLPALLERPDDDEPEPEEFDPGPEVDDEGGMSEYRYVLPDDPRDADFTGGYRPGVEGD